MNFFPSNHDFLSEGHQSEQAEDLGRRCLVETSKSNIKGENTRSDQNHDLICLRYSQNDHESLPSIEISFQKNFLAQHIQAVTSILQKTEESMAPMQPPGPLQTNQAQNRSEGPPKNPPCQFSTIREAVGGETRMVDEEFIEDLRKQKDLGQFMEYIVGAYGKEIARCLILIAADVWSEVRSLPLKELEIRDFRRRASAYSKQSAKDYSQRAEFCCLMEASQKSRITKASQDIPTKFRKVIEGYATTVLLIVGGFFENPLAGRGPMSQGQDEVDYPKRQFSSVSLGFMSYQDLFSESQFFLEPQKKVKEE